MVSDVHIEQAQQIKHLSGNQTTSPDILTITVHAFGNTDNAYVPYPHNQTTCFGINVPAMTQLPIHPLGAHLLLLMTHGNVMVYASPFPALCTKANIAYHTAAHTDWFPLCPELPSAYSSER
jgi:hypothetical protein